MPANEMPMNVSTEVSKEEADKILRHHMWGAMGVGLIPLPIVDYVAFTGIQLNMLRRLAKLYGVPFFEDKVKNIISPLIGAAIPGMIGGPIAISLAKLIPGLGYTLGVVTMPVVAGATTYALGKVFVQHFASGGTFLTFDPEKVKAHYADLFKEGQMVAAEMKK